MKKLLFLALVFLAAAFVLSNLRYLGNLSDLSKKQVDGQESKKPILRVALVADSHNENELLEKALRQAQGKGINFVIGLGDYTNLGTVEELVAAKKVFDQSGLRYYLTAGDRDGWQSRQTDGDYFGQVFGESTQVFSQGEIQFVILDNSEVYSGISQEDWEILISDLGDLGYLSNLSQKKLVFVFAHKTPFHPQSSHIMGEDSPEVARQAQKLVRLLEGKRDGGTEGRRDKGIEGIEGIEGRGVGGPERSRRVDGFFSGDLHFFAKFNSSGGSVKMTTVGAVAGERNFQGPRFSVLTVWDDYSWEVEDIEIRY